MAVLLLGSVSFAGTTHYGAIVIEVIDHRVGVDEVIRRVLDGIRAITDQRAAVVVSGGGGLADGQAKHCGGKALAFVAGTV